MKYIKWDVLVPSHVCNGKGEHCPCSPTFTVRHGGQWVDVIPTVHSVDGITGRQPRTRDYLADWKKVK